MRISFYKPTHFIFLLFHFNAEDEIDRASEVCTKVLIEKKFVRAQLALPHC